MKVSRETNITLSCLGYPSSFTLLFCTVSGFWGPRPYKVTSMSHDGVYPYQWIHIQILSGAVWSWIGHVNPPHISCFCLQSNRYGRLCCLIPAINGCYYSSSVGRVLLPVIMGPASLIHESMLALMAVVHSDPLAQDGHLRINA